MAARRPRRTPTIDPTPDPIASALVTSVTTTPEDVTFASLGVPDVLTRVLAEVGVTRPFPIQAATLPDALAGRDVLGRGRTGSGKTYAFALAVLTRLARSRAPRTPGRPRALILAPTRELATQIEAAMAPLARALSLRTLTVFGGVGARPQISALRAGVDVLVACPGRLADHVEGGYARLDAVEVTVLDEADHMADLGFLPVVRRLLDLTPRGSQRLLFSATLDAGVDVLVRRFLVDPVVHSVDSTLSPVAAMTHHVLHVHADDRFPVLVDLAAAPGRTMVFTRTKRGAKVLTRRLVAAGVPAVELHGNLAQTARTRNLEAFSGGSASTLVATDIAARGIHVDDVGLVIHADPPLEHKAYLHRSGRTARAGAAGTVVTLMTDGQLSEVRDLTRKAGIVATTTRLRPGDALLRQLAPGDRAYVAPPAGSPAPEDASTPAEQPRSRRGTGSGRGERPGNAERSGRAERSGHTGRSGHAERSARPDRSSHAEQSGGAERSGRDRTRSAAAAPRRATAAHRDTATSPAAAPVRPTGAAAFSARSRVSARGGR